MPMTLSDVQRLAHTSQVIIIMIMINGDGDDVDEEFYDDYDVIDNGGDADVQRLALTVR